MNRPPLTKAGVERLRAELDQLKREDRPRIIAAIAEARAHGDLKENAEYHAARDEQSFTEGRIKLIEGTISNAQIIDVPTLKAAPRVVFGATVELFDEDTEKEVTYHIVGDLEADIKQGRIAVTSPIARALIGKSEGDSFEFTAPNGSKSYEIVAVRYGPAD